MRKESHTPHPYAIPFTLPIISLDNTLCRSAFSESCNSPTGRLPGEKKSPILSSLLRILCPASDQMCSTAGSHFTHFVQKTKGTCLKPARGSVIEPVRLYQYNLGCEGFNPEASKDVASESFKENEKELPINQADGTVSDHESLVPRIRAMEDLLKETFSTVSHLKTSYAKLQAAHIPYDAEKLQVADKEVIREMKKLSELKQYYKHNIASGDSSGSENQIGLSYEETSTRALQVEIAQKNSEIESLKKALENVNLRRGEHRRSDRRKSARDSSSLNVGDGPTIKLLETSVQKMRESARGFTKSLISLMKSAEWDLDAAVNSIEPGINYTMESHKKLAFQSYVCMRMFSGFENENFYLTGSLSSIIDPEKHRNDCFREFLDMQNMEPSELMSILTPESLFGKFCMKKFLNVVHPRMEESFFGNLEHRHQIGRGLHPRSQFYSLFLKFAKSVWLVHRLAFSFDPPLSIFHVKRGVDFEGSYMDSLNSVNMNHDVDNTGASEGNVLQLHEKPNPTIVGFTVMPGFRVGKKAIVRSQVYVMTATPDPTINVFDPLSAPPMEDL